MPKKLALVARPDPRRAIRRLRAIGALVLVAGVAVAGGLYWIGTHRAEPPIDELIPGARAANARQMRLLYGNAVYSVGEFYRSLMEPTGQAVIVLVVSGATAAGCLRVAWLREHGHD